MLVVVVVVVAMLVVVVAMSVVVVEEDGEDAYVCGVACRMHCPPCSAQGRGHDNAAGNNATGPKVRGERRHGGARK